MRTLLVAFDEKGSKYYSVSCSDDFSQCSIDSAVSEEIAIAKVDAFDYANAGFEGELDITEAKMKTCYEYLMSGKTAFYVVRADWGTQKADVIVITNKMAAAKRVDYVELVNQIRTNRGLILNGHIRKSINGHTTIVTKTYLRKKGGEND